MNKLFSGFIFLLLSMNALAAQNLECVTFSGPPTGGQYGGPAQAEVKLASQNLPPDYRITGGGCDFGGATGFGHIVWSKPIDGGYSCKALARSGTEFIIATAYATACRVKRREFGNGLRNAAFSNAGLGGNTIGIARTVAGSIPYSIRICNLSGGVPIEVDVSATRKSRIEMNQCLEVDKPQRAFFRTPTSVSVDEHGSYSLFRAGTFPAEPRIGRATPVAGDKRVELAGFESAEAICQIPVPGEPFDSRSYWGYCKLNSLKGNKSYRVCFDTGYSNQGDALEYAGGLLRIVLDRSLMAKPNPGILDGYQYLAIAAGSCRDIFGIIDASVLVTDNSWNDQSVSKVSYRFAEIPSPK